ncbi:hypothetical protein FA15DRAFT_743291 [Coprinopsis marcescibilis]|uniref:Glycosyltransferase family 49 protein n=1 Tax=Coprinopsis marcescibilis TaxID=230819 RepID=A0A5C3KU02_COPMA|nr:hypothetical protein FA15DRAFT_743291 [Coprinopsis marcescibilis]
MYKLSRVAYLSVVSYVGFSVLYTTRTIFSSIYPTVASSHGPSVNNPIRIAKETWEKDRSVTKLDYRISDDRLLDSHLAQPLDILNASLPTMTEASRSISSDDILFSKAFSTSMRPSHVVPYFYKASGPFAEDEVTITSIITSDRLDVFSRLVERYQGPISVTFHVKNDTMVPKILDSLQKIYTASEHMRRYVDIHLVLDSFDRQFNTWRNIARLFARTDFVMMLDIDFYLCTDFRTTLRDNAWLRQKLEEGLSAFVVPAFEYTNPREEKVYSTFPQTKSELLPLINTGTIDMFHASWKPGHNNTNYAKFYSAIPGDIYKITEYQSAYEPYIIFKKAGPPCYVRRKIRRLWWQ